MQSWAAAARVSLRRGLLHTAVYIFTSLHLCILLASCINDDTFSVSSADRLTFSQDTVRVDTVFSRTPSSTRTFWVYNRTANALRCSNIRLAGGNQTGFRVNVNGVYLGASQGYQINDEELRRGDSLRVFVEATLPLNGKATPQCVTDDLVFRLESGTEQRVVLEAWGWDAEQRNGMTIERDTVLRSDLPLVLAGDIEVKAGATLTIPAGQTLYFNSGCGMTVYGRLLCLGEPGSEVTLRGSRLDRMFPYLPYDGVSGQWHGIRFALESYGNELRFTDIHSACDAIVCDSSDTSATKLTLDAATVHNNKGCGVMATDCRIVAHNTLISNTLGDCLSLTGGETELNGVTLAQFYPYDANRGAALRLTEAARDSLSRSPMAFTMSNTIVTGYDDDVLFASVSDSTLRRFTFSHCLLRTPAIADSLMRLESVVYENIEDTVVAGWKNFRLVDLDQQRYDFHLAPASLAAGSASPLTSLPTDRDALPRKETPSMGCYEAQEPKP